MAQYIPTLQDTGRIGVVIEPLDTLFFRDARPFDSGDSAQSQMPTPQTLYGMIKSYLMECANVRGHEIHRIRETNDPRKWVSQIAIQGPILARHLDEALELFFPAPSILVRRGKRNDDPLDFLAPCNNGLPGWESETIPGHEGSRTLPLLPLNLPRDLDIKADAPVKTVRELLTVKGMQAVLAGELPDERDLVKLSNLLPEEPRVGIGIDGATQTAEQGQLYTARHLRPGKGVCFYAEIGFEAPTKGHDIPAINLKDYFASPVVLPFGGEGRRVRVRLRDPFDWAQFSVILELDSQGRTEFYTTLLTPLVNRPRTNGNGGKWPGWLCATCGEPVAACVPEPLAISGWDLTNRGKRHLDGHNSTAHGCPKPTRYALAPGTTWFWRKGRHNANVLPALLQHAETPIERATGWGLALRGRWPQGGK